MKHQSYIRSLFVAFCAFFVCASAMAGELNPFAFKLSSDLVGDVFKVKYYLNAPATSVKVTITLPNDQTVVYDCTDSLNTQGTPRVKGVYDLKISLREYINTLPYFRGTHLPWSVDVMGGNDAEYPAQCNGVTLAAQKVTTEYAFGSPVSVDIDIDPLSDNFGTIYMVDRNASPDDALKPTYFPWTGTNYNTGLFVFDPAFQNIPRYGNYDFANYPSNINHTGYLVGGLYNQGFYNKFDVYNRVRISYNSDHTTRVFLSHSTKSGPILSEVNINDPDNWHSQVIGGTRESESTGVVKNGSNFVAGPNVAFDVFGGDNNLKILAISTRIAAYANRSAFRCDEYNLGTGNTITTVPNRQAIMAKVNTDSESERYNSWYKNNVKLVNNCSCGNADGCESCKGTEVVGFSNTYDRRGLEYDQHGGFWHCQYRSNHSELPSLVHFKNDGTVNFVEYKMNRRGAGVRYDKDFQRLLVAGGQEGTAYSTLYISKYPNLPQQTIDGKKQYGHPSVDGDHITIFTINNNNLNKTLINNSNKESTDDHRAQMFKDRAYVKVDVEACDMAWDYADNIYIATNTSHKFCAFALPHRDKVVSTPCKEDDYFDANPYTLTINISPSDKCGTVVDNEFRKEYKYYLPGALYSLDAVPADGYRFYCWDDYINLIGKTPTSPTTMGSDRTRTAHFGIDVWETKSITQTDETMTFKGVFVQRELDAESYSTICLPFHLESLTGTPFEGASILEFTGATPSQEDGDNRIFLEFSEVKFASGNGMRAGVPYLIKVDEPVTGEVIFNNVTCPAIGTEGETVEHSGVTFKGILNPTTFEASETNLFLVADDRLAVLTKGGTINGLRAYFIVPEGTKAENVSINVVNKVPTATPNISLLDSIQPTKYMWNGQIYIQRGNDVYNLSGAKVK